MKNAYARKLANARGDNIMLGLETMQYIALLAAVNVLGEYISEDRLPEALRALEQEMRRIWRDECRGNPEDAAAGIVVYCKELRRKYGMD